MDNKVLYHETKAEQSFLTFINAAVSHELRTTLSSLSNQAKFMKQYLVSFKKYVTKLKDEKQTKEANKVLAQIETMYTGIEKCSRKMQHATKYIDFFVGDILDYSVLNEASENFKKDFETFDIRDAITTVVDMVTDKSTMKTISIKTELLYQDTGKRSHMVNTD